MKQKSRSRVVTVALLLAAATLIGMVGVIGNHTRETAALPVYPQALEQYLPSVWDGWVPGSVVQLGVNDLNWAYPPTMIHSPSAGDPPLGYDSRAYTEERSAEYNGYVTPDHVVMD